MADSDIDEELFADNSDIANAGGISRRPGSRTPRESEREQSSEDS